jgi:hypothetical protein
MNMQQWTCLTAAALLSACSATTTIDEFRPTATPTEIGAGEKIVILGRRDAGNYETDRDFVNCVGDKLKGPGIAVLPEQDFIDAIYPWFEPRTAPRSLRRLTRLMEEPVIKERITREDIRYLVWLDGSTETQGKAGSMSCALGPVGGGCLGFTQWDKVSVYEAIVWDLTDLTEKGRIRVDSSGTSYLIGVIVPIPLLSPVKNDACAGLVNQLKTYFTTEGG